MHAPTNPAVPLTVIRTAAARLAAPLVKHELNVTVGRLGIVEIRNPRDTRMRQPIVLREHQGGMWWHWLWSENDAPPELEPMCPADDVADAARRIANVLAVRAGDETDSAAAAHRARETWPVPGPDRRVTPGRAAQG